MPTHPLGWSLLFEVTFYTMLAGAMLWKTYRPLGERVLIILAINVFLGSLVNFKQPWNIIGNPIIFEFAFGVIIGIFWKKSSELPRYLTVGLFVVSSVLLLWSAIDGYGVISEAQYTLNVSSSWMRIRIWGMPAALLVASAVFRPQKNINRASLAEFLGNASYSIYLFSFPALCVLDWWWEFWNFESVDLMIIYSTIVSVIIGVIGYIFIEIPCTRFFHGIFLKYLR